MNKQIVLKEFEELVAIESVSTDPDRVNQIKLAVEFLTKKLSSLGFKIETFTEKDCSPLVVASYIVNSEAKTIGIYGHYDVQPEDPMKEWGTPPFKLTLKDGKFLGRGTADNKGHIIQNITALRDLITKSKLSNNILFILEGEEETGSVHLEELLVKAKDLVSIANVFFVTDVGMHKKNHPQIFYGLRGLIYFDLEVTIGNRDLHSGIYGNRVYNPIQIISELFAKIKESQSGKILIPHFYDDVRPVTEKELQVLQKLLRSDEELRREAGVIQFAPTVGHPHLASKIYPSFDGNGIMAGYTGVGAKTVIPRSAKGKFSFRLVENQDPEKIEILIRSFIKKEIPSGVDYELTTLSKDAPFYTSLDNEYVRKTATILKQEFGEEVLFNRSGGSIPASEIFQRLFKKPVILTGFTLPDDNLHAPNENFDEEMFWKGIEALKKIYNHI